MTEFMDSLALIAAINRRDQYHDAVAEYLKQYMGKFVTTEWVLMEATDALSEAYHRSAIVTAIRRMRTDSRYRIVPYDLGIYDAGFDLYSARPDKNWSLIDCISFVVMEQFNLADAMTEDHHFRQAGFNPIFEKVP
jgi:predicted nucleic acid-binding protein